MINNSINKLKALYWANNGDILPSVPMKMYNGYMLERINQASSNKLKKLAWQVTHVATGILAYPVLGALASLDMAITLINWNLNGKDHNKRNDTVKWALYNTHGAPASRATFSFLVGPNTSFRVFREYDIRFGPETKQSEYEPIKEAFIEQMKSINEEFTKAYTKLYVEYSGTWETGMNFKFVAEDSSLPYCSNPYLPKLDKIDYCPYFKKSSGSTSVQC